MKRHIALEGDRKWFSNHITELQSEALSAIDKMASYYGPCALSGGETYEVNTTTNKNKFRAGLVVLWVQEKLQWMVMPLNDTGLISGYNTTRYVIPSKTNIQGEYRMGAGLIAEQYEAIVVSSQPSGSSNGYITIPSCVARIPDLMQALNLINAQRNIFAKHIHQHSDIEETISVFNTLKPNLCWLFDGGFVINIGKPDLNIYGQLRFGTHGVEHREARPSQGSQQWSPWVSFAAPKQSIDVTVSSYRISPGFEARASKHDGYVNLNFFGTIMSDEDTPDVLISLLNVAPISTITLFQPLTPINLSSVIYRKLYVRQSGYNTSIQMDTTNLRDLSFSLNITFEYV